MVELHARGDFFLVLLSYAHPAFGGKVEATASNLGWGQPSLVCLPFSLACRCLPLSNIDSLALVRTHFFLIEAGRLCVSKSALDLVLTLDVA